MRCVFRLGHENPAPLGAQIAPFEERIAPLGAQIAPFEERITLWCTENVAAAVACAEREAHEYAALVGGEYAGLAQVYQLDDELSHGAEIFSLMRASELDSEEYLDRFFDTGAERQGSLD